MGRTDGSSYVAFVVLLMELVYRLVEGFLMTMRNSVALFEFLFQVF